MCENNDECLLALSFCFLSKPQSSFLEPWKRLMNSVPTLFYASLLNRRTNSELHSRVHITQIRLGVFKDPQPSPSPALFSALSVYFGEYIGQRTWSLSTFSHLLAVGFIDLHTDKIQKEGESEILALWELSRFYDSLHSPASWMLDDKAHSWCSGQLTDVWWSWGWRGQRSRVMLCKIHFFMELALSCLTL